NVLASASADATVRLWQAPPLPTARPEPVDVPSVPPVETTHLFALELQGSAGATRASEENVHRVDVTVVDGTVWHDKLFQGIDDLQEGAAYTIRFRARADVPRSITLYGQIDEPDWHGIGLSEDIPLTRNWQEYQYEFQAKDIVAWNKIQFLLGQQT